MTGASLVIQSGDLKVRPLVPAKVNHARAASLAMAASKKDFLARPVLQQVGIAAGFAIIAGFVTTVIAAELAWVLGLVWR
jgi:hypothetical protein